MFAMYTVDVVCMNCGKHYPDDIPKGTTIANRECKKCGCSTLQRETGKTLSEMKENGNL